MTLTVTTEPREQRQLAVSIQAPQERVDQELRKAASKLSSQYRMPGFRAGKAPYHIVVRQFGLANLYNEFVDELGQELFKQAIEQEHIEPYAMASLEDIQFDPLVYRLIVPLEPIVDLGDYRSLRVEEPQAESDDSLVEARLAQLREQHSEWQTVDRPSQYGDTMTIDVKSVILPDGDQPEIVVLDETDWDVTPDEEHPMDPPGFDAALIGLKSGETKEFVLSWPAESQSVHAGKEATFRVKVNTIEAYELPPLDDSLAPLIDPDATTLEEVRANLREEVGRRQNAERREEYLRSALDAIVAQSTLDYPPAVVEDQMDSMVQNLAMQLRRFGIDDIDRYFEQIGQDRDAYREGLREEATRQAERNLVLSEIVKAEKLVVSDAEIEDRINVMAGASSPDELADDATDEDASEDASDVADVEANVEAIVEAIVEANVEAIAEAIAEAGEEAGAESDDEAGEDFSEDLREDLSEDLSEVETQIAAMANLLRSPTGRNLVANDLLREKSVERVLAIVRGEAIPPPTAEEPGPATADPAANEPAADEPG